MSVLKKQLPLESCYL